MIYKRGMWFPFQTTARVPNDLASITSIADTEVPPHSLGVSPAGLDAIWQAVVQWYRSGIHPAIQICVRRNGEILLNRAIGFASGGGPDDPVGSEKVACTIATPFNTFSASKGVTAMVIHLLDQKRVLHLDDHVCDYIPEFGCHNKEWITIRHLLTHRAGIPNVPPEAMRLEQLADRDGLVRIMCDAVPIAHPGRQVTYHALTGGFVLGEVVRRATGKTIGQVLHEGIRKPLGMQWFTYGAAADVLDRVAHNYCTGLPIVFPVSTLMRRALGVDFETAVAMSNDRRFLLSEVPSGNLVATAEEMSRFYELLLEGGELDGVAIFEPRTVRRAVAEQSYFEIDTTLGMPFRYSMGFMLGARWMSMYGPDTERAFGHLGFTNVVSWADPERQIAGSIMTSGKPLLYPGLYSGWDVLRQIGNACTKDGARVPITAAKVRSIATSKGKRPRITKQRADKTPQPSRRIVAGTPRL